MQIQRFCLYKQIELFQETQYLIKSKIGNKEADKFFQEAQYVVALGSNDFINNYLMPVYSDSWIYPDDSFVQYLMQTLREQLSANEMIKKLGFKPINQTHNAAPSPVPAVAP
ncbi:GDSL esterase/lipase [Forsythia ovata]|uniref:GDSL esterase/lipase n=1 Tax=Forsythia ovata TaxID=205694 RepID=A0ABD1TBI7_9LAMI